ncbi:MAG: ABC transporter ATP-binding protein [Anaerofustis stercorihominis]|nr:ABC transporter ATP-binding protein [Anaerofustis stercorihominis]
MSKVLLKAENLGISFGGLKAVNNFNLELYEGELVGLIGPNGAGKTTVFNLLTGVYKPTEGNYYIGDEKMNGKPTYAMVRAGVARTFQNIKLFGQMTVIENVMVAMDKALESGFIASLFHLKKFWKEEESIRIRAMELLEVVGLSDKADVTASNLPYGQQRKLEIARALATDMKVLMLDEPAAGMNPTETAELLEIINLIRKKFGISILLIEHDMALVMKVCERITVLDYGNIIATGTPQEIAKNKQVIEAYLGKDDEEEDTDA